MTQARFSMQARQQLSVSPRLQQSIRLLQISALELEQELRQAAVSNPFLEDDESRADGIESPPTEAGDAEADLADQEPDRISTSDSTEPLALDIQSRHGSASDDERSEPIDWAFHEPSLRDHLRAQICGGRTPPSQRLALEVLIESIDDDGYLRSSIADLVEALDLTMSISEVDLEAALTTLQGFDPAGVGARSLSECLMLQLTHADGPGEECDIAMAIARSHLALLAQRDHGALCQQLGCDNEALQRAIAQIRRLDPHPGERYSTTHAGYVTPDVIVTVERSRLTININPEVLPRVRLNRSYAQLMRQRRTDATPGLSQQLKEARWLMRNIEQRFITIKRVADAIVRRQRTFFSYGDAALKPLVLREIADELELHESTISRATGNKYMATPRGTYEFKHFFSRELPTGTGGRCSSTAVRALMQDILDEEDRRAPLSDVTLAHMLSAQGICIARRTVAKYRTMMKVPPAELRRIA